MEKGARPVEASMLVRLAELYGTTVGHLVGAPAAERPPSLAVRLREGFAGRLDGPEVRAQLNSFFKFCERYARLRADASLEPVLPNLPPPPPGADGPTSQVRKYEVEGDAASLRSHWGLGDGPVGERIFDLLEENGVVPYREVLPNQDISGAFVEAPGLGVAVLINACDHPHRQVFTAAHELAHVLYHRPERVGVSLKGDHGADESLANQFASAFLMPEGGVKRYLSERAPRAEGLAARTVVGLQRHFGVSYAAMLVRLENLNIVRGEQYLELKGASPVRLALELSYPVAGWELDHRPEEAAASEEALSWVPRRFLGLVLEAMEAGRLLERQAAGYLGVDFEVLNAHLLRLRDLELDRDLAAEFEDAEASVV